MEVSERCEMACDILRVTNDGDDLDPIDLRLLEWAVNAQLSELGEERFHKLHDTVTKGEYVKPYWHGVKYITRDHEGYIYYKDRQVEHFNTDYAYSKRCIPYLRLISFAGQELEKRGILVGFSTISNFLGR